MPLRLKELIRAIGVDDGYFPPRKPGTTKLVMVLLRADNRLEGVLSTDIEVDGTDSTEKIISALKNSSFPEQASFIFLDGINFAGFNITNAEKVSKELSLPVIIVFRKNPDLQRIKRALKKFENARERIALIDNAGKIFRAKKILFQCHGLSEEHAKKAIEKFTIHSHLPEPVRIAHLIASAVTLGKSTTP